MQRYTPTILSFKLLWDKAIVLVLPHYRILPFVSKISCPGMLVTCLWITQRRLKSFTSRFTQRLNQFLPSRLEIVQSLQVVKSRALGSYLTAFSLLKLTSTTFVALLHVLFTTSEKLRTSYLDLLRNVLFVHLIFFFKTWFLQQHSSRPTLLRVRKTTTIAKYNREANC